MSSPHTQGMGLALQPQVWLRPKSMLVPSLPPHGLLQVVGPQLLAGIVSPVPPGAPAGPAQQVEGLLVAVLAPRTLSPSAEPVSRDAGLELRQDCLPAGDGRGGKCSGMKQRLQRALQMLKRRKTKEKKTPKDLAALGPSWGEESREG